MGLCVAGANAARGEILFFTESHCWPESDVLERTLQALQDHPEWAGFSAKSIRSTHNRLSEVEADMYEADIEYGMLHHPWRRILDQCFVVRRSVYEESGGFQAEFGHFAEWLLAARFYEKGLVVGYAPEARVHHHYVGNYRELEEFTEDFTTGLANYLTHHSDDSVAPLFPEVPYLSQPGNWSRSAALHLMQLCLHGNSALQSRLIECLRWGFVACWGFQSAVMEAWWKSVWTRWRLQWALLFSKEELQQLAMRNYCTKLVERSGARLLRSVREIAEPLPRGEIQFGRSISFIAAGFHLREEWQGQPCRWSLPEAMIELALQPGSYQVELRCLPVHPISICCVKFYQNGKRVPESEIELGDNVAMLNLHVEDQRPCRLGWTCRSLHAPSDPRRLGLLVDRLTWRRVDRSDEKMAKTA